MKCQQLQSGLEDLNTSVKTSLIPGIEAYMKGVSQIHDGLGKLEHQNQTLLQGSQQLTDGLLSFKQQTPALFGGIEQLNQGVKALYDGTTTLISQNETIMQGSTQLTQGSTQIKAGAKQLSDGSLTLSDGLQTLQNGTQKLDESLKEGVEKANFHIQDSTLDMMSAPVETSHEAISTVTNNGHAMVFSFLLDVLINALGFLPSIFVSTANGLLFGIVPGIILSWLAETTGVIISFILMRTILRSC